MNICTLLEQRRTALREKYPFWTKNTLYEHLQKASLAWPDRVLYRDGQKSLTYSQILSLSDKAARSFVHLGIKKGDRVAVNLNNTSEYLILTFALAKAGAVKVPLNRKLPLQQKCYILSETGVSVLVTDKTEDIEALHLCAPLRRIIMLRHPEKSGSNIISWEMFQDVLSQAAFEMPVCTTVLPEDPDDGKYTQSNAIHGPGAIEAPDEKNTRKLQISPVTLSILPGAAEPQSRLLLKRVSLPLKNFDVLWDGYSPIIFICQIRLQIPLLSQTASLTGKPRESWQSTVSWIPIPWKTFLPERPESFSAAARLSQKVIITATM